MQINLRHKFPQFVFFAKGDVSKASYDVRAGGGDGSGGVGLEAGCPGAGGGLPCLHLEPPAALAFRKAGRKDMHIFGLRVLVVFQ